MLVGILFLVGCQQEENQFVVGLECDYPPYSWTTLEDDASEYGLQVDGSSQYCDGYDTRLASYVANEMGMELVVKKISWDGLPAALNAGQIDAIIAAMSPTPERKQTMNFTEAYFTEVSEQVVVVRIDSSYSSATDLGEFSGGTFISQLGTFQVGLITQMTGAEAGTHLADFPSVINATLAGTVDGYVAEYDVANAQVANNDELVMIRFSTGFVLDPSFNTVAIALRLEDVELRDSLNDALATISDLTRETWMEESSERAAE